MIKCSARSDAIVSNWEEVNVPLAGVQGLDADRVQNSLVDCPLSCPIFKLHQRISFHVRIIFVCRLSRPCPFINVTGDISRHSSSDMVDQIMGVVRIVARL